MLSSLVSTSPAMFLCRRPGLSAGLKMKVTKTGHSMLSWIIPGLPWTDTSSNRNHKNRKEMIIKMITVLGSILEVSDGSCYFQSFFKSGLIDCHPGVIHNVEVWNAPLKNWHKNHDWIITFLLLQVHILSHIICGWSKRFVFFPCLTWSAWVYHGGTVVVS